mmetsp:Transcript_69175/g.123147  ORF Transcript_69175/g.123147 Transcript_69175/m.123147 type:complete len:233 (+) Transcript_69175:74-772(+)
MTSLRLSGGSWEQSKSKATSLKAQLDTKLLELSRLAGRLNSAASSASGSASAGIDGGFFAQATTLREEVERDLRELADVTELLGRSAAPGQQAAQASRLRETYQELMRDFKLAAQNMDQQKHHASLLSKRKDNGSSAFGDEEAGLIRERGALDTTLSMTDEVLAQATATRDNLSAQRATLGNVSGKVGTVASRLPTIDGLIKNISDKKTKEQVVLSLTVAGCCFFTLWYKVF